MVLALFQDNFLSNTLYLLPEILSGYNLVQGGGVGWGGHRLCPKFMKFGQYVQKKILRFLGVKGHRVHLFRSRKTTVKGQKTSIFE